MLFFLFFYRICVCVCFFTAAAFEEAPESGPQTAKRTSAMAGLVARFLPVVEAFFVANARDPKGAEVNMSVLHRRFVPLRVGWACRGLASPGLGLSSCRIR